MKNVLLFLVALGLMASTITQAEELESMQVATGKAKFNALFQFWAYNDTTIATENKTNMRARRAELKFTGSVVENTRWFVMIDPAKTLSLTSAGALSSTNDNKVLQDIGMAYSITPELELIAGQMKILTGIEGLDWSADTLLAERAMTSRAYGDKREPGVQLMFKNSMFKLGAMVSNGQNNNVDDNTNSNAKDLTVRGDLNVIDGLSVGAFTQAGDFKYRYKSRFGANIKAAFDRAIFRVEGMGAQDLGVNANGLYADLGYMVTDHWQPAIRYDRYHVGGVEARAPGATINYFFNKNFSKIQFSVWRLDNAIGSRGSYVISNGVNGTLATLAFQTAL